MKYGIRSYLHVIVQFVILGYFAVNGNFYKNIVLLVIEVLGFLLAIWSLWVMRKSVLSVFPNPEPSAKLISKGPYRVIRHPMYTSLLLILIPMLISYFTYTRLIILLIFISNMVFKTLYEEILLRKYIEGYTEYAKRTRRIIPFIL